MQLKLAQAFSPVDTSNVVSYISPPVKIEYLWAKLGG